MRKRITLIEMLFVLAIQVIFFGLIVSATQKVRMTAMNSKSQGKVSQIMCATANYASANNDRLPWMNFEIRPKFLCTTHVLLLPYLENDELYRVYLNNERLNDYSIEERPVGFKVYISPLDDSLRHGLQLRNLSYSVNAMVFDPVRREPIADLIQDGLSNTLGFVETRMDCRGLQRNAANSAYGRRFRLDGTIDSNSSRPTVFEVPQQFLDLDDFYPGSPYLKPGMTFQTKPSRAECDPRLANSNSTSGLIVGFLDGSVRTYSPKISPSVYWGSVTPAGGEVISYD